MANPASNATFTVTNLIADPSFENNGWQANSNVNSLIGDTSIKYDGNQSVKLTSGTDGECLITAATYPSLVQNHIYYCFVYKYETGTISNIQFYWPVAEPSLSGGNSHTSVTPVASQWVRYSCRNSRNSWSSGNYQFRIDYENAGQSRTCWLDGCVLIDLTADFGSGNEPDLEWCDNNIPFFIGTYTYVPYLPLRVKDHGVWKKVKEGYKKENGQWTEITSDNIGNKITNSIIARPKYFWGRVKMTGVNSDENTLLLLKGNDLKDYSSNNFTIENFGVTKSNESKFGGGSLYFNGSSYLKISNPSVFEFGQEDPFTYEMWIKHDSPLPSKFFYFNGDTQGAFFWGFLTNWFTFGKNNVGYDVEGPVMGTSVLSQFYNWTYLKITHPCPAIDKSTRALPETGNPGGTDLGVYIGAAQIAAYYLKESFSLENGSLIIGAESSNGTVADYFKGYIEAIRISNVVRDNGLPDYYFGTESSLELLTSSDSNKYPSNGFAADGYYYVKI